MLGFKSFADKISLNFQDGVTAIVGPNGCGKSNVADAIRWVLGEQSAKALRGGAMQDVIFSGTDRRKPLQLAEVSMTLDDVTENQLQAAGLDLSYSEVTITRRVYRDGGSEYYINKTQCRLRDIQQLFMGTGVGRTSYSIMAQGNITQILSSKPDDRRLIFEEAAGITRYKVQKREALRKLEHTEQNLLRVEDLIGEVKRRIGTLQRQAGKAKKYKEIMDALKTLDTQLGRHKLDLWESDKDRIQKQITDYQDLKALREGEYTSMEEVVETLRQEQSEVDSRLSEAQQHLTSIRAELEQNHERIGFHEQRILEIDEQKQQAANESVEADERLKAANSELTRASAGLNETEKSLSAQREVLQEKNEALLVVERKLTDLQDQMNQFQAKAYSTAQELAQLNNQINRFDLQKQGDIARLEKLQVEKRQLEEESVSISQRLDEEQRQLDECRAYLESAQHEIHESETAVQEARNQSVSRRREMDDCARQVTEKESRLGVLQQLEADQDGLEPGTQKVLQDFEGRVRGMLIDHIKVRDEFITAVEAVLHHRFEMIIAEEASGVLEILDFVESRGQGRVQLGILNEPDVHVQNAVDSGDGRLVDLIDCEVWLRPLLERMAGNYVVVSSIREAFDMRRKSGGKLGFVTRHGECVDPSGVVTSSGKKSDGSRAAASSLARKNQIDALQHEISSLQSSLNGAQARMEEIESHIANLESELNEKKGQQKSREIEAAGMEAGVRSLRASTENLTRKIEVTAFEIERLEGTQSGDANQRQELANRKDDLENQAESIRTEMNRVAEELESVRKDRDHAGGELTEAKVVVASNEQVMRGYRNQIDPLKQRIQELQDLLVQRGRDQESFAQRRVQSLEAIETARESISTLEIQIEESSVELGELQSQKQSIVENIRMEETRLREFRGQINQIQTDLTRLEVEIAQKNMHIESLIERIRERYQVDIREIPTECITITLADNGPPEVHKLTPEEMEESGAGTDWELVEEQVKDLQSKVDSMGPVNLVAIEEYEETEQRYEFLHGQHQDLLNARDALMEAVNRINTETREMFLGTFYQIRTNFQSTFEEIFGGGTADLTLVDEEDVLESGIDIVARPPGKKLQSISLLSGGEQTMTAVALLFAIYEVKPSPFCVLDELDAPLDESNINRFLKILKRFVGQSQFLIITHNKRTISMADTLYGVTMQERGVSKIISVRFRNQDNGGEVEDRAIENVIHGNLT